MNDATSTKTPSPEYDVFVIGGGINGCGIARDAAGRGLRVALAEMDDLASATSSASTKLFHGGLRYLEYFEFRLVREALIERETLLRAMPHISWPMRFVLPYHKDLRFEADTPTSRLLSFVMPWMKGRRPAWLIRLGLFLYDHLGGRKILPGTSTLDLTKDPAGAILSKRFRRAYEYSDCWVQDARLVVLNARDAKARGARIMTRTKVISADRHGEFWTVTTQDVETGQQDTHTCKFLINAGGPWVGQVVRDTAHIQTNEGIRLVRGSHIVTKKLYEHDKAYFLQGTDGRIIFTIPYEGDFTLVGTTEAPHPDPSLKPECTQEESDYLRAFVSDYFRTPVNQEDIVWSYSGVRPLYDDGASSATAATRDYVLSVNTNGGAPILNVFGGKITTYRRLAESALDKMADSFPGLTPNWTAGVTLPGGDFPVDGFDDLVAKLQDTHRYLKDDHAHRLLRTYGTEAFEILAGCTTATDMGQEFSPLLFQCEVDWAIRNEFVCRAEDLVWRRTKLGLHLSAEQIGQIDTYIQGQRTA